MESNREFLDWLFEQGKIDLRRSALFDHAPAPMPQGPDWSRVEGMMLGLAIGDSLGNTSESMLPGARKSRFGEIRDFLPNYHASGKPVGLPSDDTQLAFWTLEQMIEDRGFDPENVARRFCRERIFGIGSTVRAFVATFKGGMPWYESGPKSAGNGALMRIAPMVIPHLKTASPDLWVDTALSSMITHNDSGSISACLSFVNILWHLLGMSGPPDPTWWLETYVQTAKGLETDDRYRPRGGVFTQYQGFLWRFVEERVGEAYERGMSALEASNQWYSGAYLLETVPSALLILMKHAGDPEEAIVRAVNDTKDNDTIGAIVGAAVGALHGKAGIPERWIRNLSGRTSFSNNGRVFQIMAEAGAIWG